MKKHEVLSALDRIYQMSNEEISINAEWIRKIANNAFGLIKQKDGKKSNK